MADKPTTMTAEGQTGGLDIPSGRLLGLDEVSGILGVSARTVKEEVHSGELGSMKVRRRRLVHPEDLADYIERQRTAAE